MINLPVTLLNFMLYQDKETKVNKIRIGYLVSDKSYCQDNLKFKGYPECAVYLDNAEIWDKLSVDMCYKQAELVFEEVPSVRNPLKKYNKLKGIRTKDVSIDIL